MSVIELHVRFGGRPKHEEGRRGRFDRYTREPIAEEPIRAYVV